MPQLGAFEYPTITIDDAIRFAKALRAKFGNHAFNAEALARSLGLRNASDKRFAAALKDLRSYGILTGPDEVLRITALAGRLSGPEVGKDYVSAVVEAAFNVQLIKGLAHALLGRIPPPGISLVPLLAALTDTDIKQVPPHADRITKLYAGVMRRIGGMRIPAPANR